MIKSAIKNMYDKAIFHGSKIVLEEKGGQRKIAMNVEDIHLPLMTWSAGQKEFMPFVLTLLSDTARSLWQHSAKSYKGKRGYLKQ